MNADFDKGERKAIAKAVTIAALSALATGLVKWGLDFLRVCQYLS